jgi:hypothetical protein
VDGRIKSGQGGCGTRIRLTRIVIWEKEKPAPLGGAGLARDFGWRYETSAAALLLSAVMRPLIPCVLRMLLNSERRVASSLIVPFR